LIELVVFKRDCGRKHSLIIRIIKSSLSGFNITDRSIAVGGCVLKKIGISNEACSQHDSARICSTGLSPGATDITPLRGWGRKINYPFLPSRFSTVGRPDSNQQM